MKATERREAAAAARVSRTGITFHHPGAFWLGTTMLVVGVLMHMPDYFASRDMDFAMAGMEMSFVMLAGMAFILLGLVLAIYGLFPRKAVLGSYLSEAERLQGMRFRAMDDTPLTPAHWGLLFVLGVALVIDVMKPATLGFVVPGLRDEYGISTGQAALLPLFALTGTTIGSFLWGVLADRLGRRATILLSSLMFVGTAICGAMPAYQFNFFMCFLMGMAAGGMLPIVYALMAESVPAKKRGWLVVLHGGMGTAGGYLAASGAAYLLLDDFGWRMLWFLNLPTGLLMLLLNRWIPESPRFLLSRGRVQEASGVMARYGVEMQKVEGPAEEEVAAAGEPDTGVRQLFRHPYLPRSMSVVLYGLAWGLINWGFITFLPTILEDQGYRVASASGLLFISSLIAVPATVLVAYMYGVWSSRKSMILYALAAALTLVGFATLDPAENRVLLIPLFVLLLVSTGGIISMLSPYTAEIYPTHLRGTGSGLAAGSSKIGGIIAPPVFAGIVGSAAGLTIPAVLVAVPVAVSAGVLWITGVETRGRRLEEVAGPASAAREPDLAGTRETP